MSDNVDKTHNGPWQSGQTCRAYDDSPERFRNRNRAGAFSGASGVLFEQAMAQTRIAICLADPHSEGQPIVFTNRAFCDLTGYNEDEIVGQNCGFLQGPDTDPEQVAKIRAALDEEKVVVVELLSYRKDGSTFWSALHLGPIYDDNDRLIYYFGSQWDVSDVHAARADSKHAKAMAREMSHRIKNLFSVITGVVSVTGRTMDTPHIARTINDRIQALGRAYEPTLDEAASGTIEVGQAIRAVLAPYDPERTRIAFLGNSVRTDPNLVSTLGLVLHELTTNATKYGALSTPDGSVSVDWHIDAIGEGDFDRFVVEWVERGGPAIEAPPVERGTGFSIIDTLLRPSNGVLRRQWESDGLRALLILPAYRGS